MTRGREANHAYVVTAETTDEGHQRGPDRTARDVLESILAHADAERSAHEVMREELDRISRLDRLVPIHEHLCQLDARERYRLAFAQAGLSGQTTEIEGSPSFGALIAALRHAENRGLPPDQMLRRAIAMAPLQTAKDLAAVLHARIDRLVRRADRRGELESETTIAGIVPPAGGAADDMLAGALRNTEHLIAERAAELARRAIESDEPWLRSLEPPTDRGERAEWQTAVERVAAYRERHGVHSADPLGPEPPTSAHAHLRDWRNIRDHLERRTRVASTAPSFNGTLTDLIARPSASHHPTID